MSNVFFYEPFYDLDRFINEALTTRQAGQGDQVQSLHRNNNPIRAMKPRMDLHENSEKNIVTATFEFPGISKENIQIDLHSGRLVVSAETKESIEHDANGYAVRERRFGKSSRTLQLPQGVKEEDVKASMENGVLTVTFPKTTPELASKKITIA
ncbi:HSP20-like chaperone [Panaeolus papilionaceus]|nr:HSP20-like chaperone [Panaeolus papilionaceus]